MGSHETSAAAVAGRARQDSGEGRCHWLGASAAGAPIGSRAGGGGAPSSINGGGDAGGGTVEFQPSPKSVGESSAC